MQKSHLNYSEFIYPEINPEKPHLMYNDKVHLNHSESTLVCFLLPDTRSNKLTKLIIGITLVFATSTNKVRCVYLQIFLSQNR